MKVLLLIIPDGYDKAKKPVMADMAVLKAMTKYNDMLHQAGVLRSFNGLHPPVSGIRIKASGGRQIIQHPPFDIGAEALGGYWVLKVESMEKAIEWALLCPLREGEALEIRRIHEWSEFSDEARAIFEDYPAIHERIKKYVRPKSIGEREQTWEGEGGAVLERN